MRHYLVIAVIAAIAFSVTAPISRAAKHTHRLANAPPPPSTSGIQDRYCLQGSGFGYPGNCEFSTFEQCMATASGQDAGCGINPLYAFAPQQR